MSFGNLEHSKEKVYEVDTLSGLSWPLTRAASYKAVRPGESDFSAFCVSFLELLQVYSNNVVP